MNNRVSTYWFDDSMYTKEVQDPEGRYTYTKYYMPGGINKYGDILETIDRNGNKTEFNIDGKGNVVKKINCSDNSSSEYGYDDKNNLIWEKDEEGNYTYYQYENGTTLKKKAQPLQNISLTEGTDVKAFFENEIANNSQNYAITVFNYYSSLEAQSQYNCNVAGLLSMVTDPEGKQTSYTYDRDGNIKTVTDAESKTFSYEYNRTGFKTAEITAKGFRTEYVYDKNGQLEKSVNITGGNTSRIVYNILGQKIQEIKPEQYNPQEDNISGHSYNNPNAGFRYEYHDSGKLKKVTNPEGYVTEYSYDCYGNLIQETRHNGSLLKYYYDVLDRLIRTTFKDSDTSAEVLLSEISYAVLENGKSQKTEIKYLNDTERAITVYISDYAGRTVEQQNPDGTKIKTEYNSNGTIKSITQTNGSTIYYKYDSMARLLEQWVPFEITNGNVKYTYSKIEYYKTGGKNQRKPERIRSARMYRLQTL